MGKQDMCSKYAQNHVEAFEEMTEEQARMAWNKEVHDILMNLRTRLTESISMIFPLKCPNCDSFKITVVFGTSRSLECLSCRSKFLIKDKR